MWMRTWSRMLGSRQVWSLSTRYRKYLNTRFFLKYKPQTVDLYVTNYLFHKLKVSLYRTIGGLGFLNLDVLKNLPSNFDVNYMPEFKTTRATVWYVLKANTYWILSFFTARYVAVIGIVLLLLLFLFLVLLGYFYLKLWYYIILVGIHYFSGITLF